MDDTRPEIRERMNEAYRRMSGAEKLRRVWELTRAARSLAEARLREEFPTASDREITLRLAALRLDRETMLRVFGWAP